MDGATGQNGDDAEVGEVLTADRAADARCQNEDDGDDGEVLTAGGGLACLSRVGA